MDRTELEDKLREAIDGHARDMGCPVCDMHVKSLMAVVDEYTASQNDKPEMWTAEQVAEHLHLPDRNQARVVLSRAKIPGVSGKHPDTNRRTALYRADQVRKLGRERAELKKKRGDRA